MMRMGDAARLFTPPIWIWIVLLAASPALADVFPNLHGNKLEADDEVKFDKASLVSCDLNSEKLETTAAGVLECGVNTPDQLAADGANCLAGEAPLGVDAFGAVQGCFSVGAAGSDLISVNGTAVTDALGINIIDGDIDWTHSAGVSPDTLAATVGCTDCVTMATETTGNFVATVADSGASTVTVSGSGSENAAVTLLVTDVSCTGCLGATEIAGLDAGDVTTGTFADARVDGSLEADEVNPTLGTQTQGSYVEQVADGTGIDGTANAETATYTPTLDLTEINSLTWGSGTFTAMTFNAGVTDPVFTFGSDSLIITNVATLTVPNDSWGDAEIADVFLLNNGDVGTGVYDFGGATSFEIVNGTGPTVDAAGEIAVDTSNDDQLVFFGDAKRVIQAEQVVCKVIENLAADDDNMPFWSPGSATTDNLTLVSAWCYCTGTCTTEADITFEIREVGTASTVDDVGGTVDCEDEATGDTPTTLTADVGVDGLDLIRFDVDNTPVPETDTYTLCLSYTWDAQ